jgi:hypothetical protein
MTDHSALFADASKEGKIDQIASFLIHMFHTKTIKRVLVIV